MHKLYGLNKSEMYKKLNATTLKDLLNKFEDITYFTTDDNSFYVELLKQETHLITSSEDIRNCQHLLETNIMAVDCEFFYDGRRKTQVLSLVQIAVYRGVLIFDLLGAKDYLARKKMIGVLKNKFQNSQVEKIFHDVSSDSRILYEQEGIRLNNVYDTQVDWDLIQYPNSEKLFPNGKISLKDLLIKYNIETNPLKDSMKKSFGI